MKKKSCTHKKIFLLSFLSLFFLTFSLGLYLYYQPSYKIVDRIKQMKKTEEKYKDTVIGWLRVEGTNIDLPIIYPENEDDVEKGTYNFAWSVHKNDHLLNLNTIISHNILNISDHPLKESKNFTRFENLPAFLYEDFARENQLIQYSVDGKNYLYRIFAVSIVKKTEFKYPKENYSKEQLKKYIANSLKESYYKYDTSVNENDKILTLSTCTRFFGRRKDYMIRIDARKIRTLEKAENVSLKTNENYESIKKIMEQ